MTRLRQRLERLEQTQKTGPRPTDGMTEDEIDRRLVEYYFRPKEYVAAYTRDAAAVRNGDMELRTFVKRYKRHARPDTPAWLFDYAPEES